MGIFTKKADSEPPKQEKSEVDSLLDAFSAKLDERLKPLQDTVTAIQSEWDGLKAEAEKSNAPPPEDLNSLTTEQKLERGQQALFALTVQANARMTEAETISSLPDHWRHLVPQLKEMFASFDIQTKGMKNYAERCQNCVDLLIGRAARSGGVRTDSSTGKFFIEDAAGKTGGDESPLNDYPTWQDPRSGRTETPSQTLQKLGIDPVKFAQDHKSGLV